MEMNFREYCETFWGPAAGATAGWMMGAGTPLSYPLAAAGGYLGHRAEKWYRNLMNPQYNPPKTNPKFFVYYRDLDNQVHKELLPNEYIDCPECEQKNADASHPYFYYLKQTPEGNRMMKRIKAGYQGYQRRSKSYGYNQAYGGYGQRYRNRGRGY